MASRLFYSGPDLATLYSDYAAKGRIDEAAPITSSASAVIDAPVERVWEVLADVRNWPSWYPGYEVLELNDVAAGAKFRWKLGSSRMKSTFAVVDAGSELTWTGVSLWFRAIDRHVLESLGDGRTRMTVSESMAGALLPLIYSADKVHAVQEKRLTALKNHVEKER